MVMMMMVMENQLVVLLLLLLPNEFVRVPLSNLEQTQRVHTQHSTKDYPIRRRRTRGGALAVDVLCLQLH